MLIPPTVVEKAGQVYGADGLAWAEALPATLDACRRRWQIEDVQVFEGLSFGYVARVQRRDAEDAVLKLTYPQGEEALLQPPALRAFAGRASVRLLDDAPELGAMLLELVEPATTAETLAEDEATRALAGVMRSLRGCQPPAAHAFPTVADWATGFDLYLRATFDGGTGPMDPALVAQAEDLFRDLLADSGPQLLLHGDLHHGNVLAARREPWLVIDPKGVIGEAEYETAAMLRNPYGRPQAQANPVAFLARRIAILGDELGYDRQRIRGWGVAQSVLSAAWSAASYVPNWHLATEVAEWLNEVSL